MKTKWYLEKGLENGYCKVDVLTNSNNEEVAFFHSELGKANLKDKIKTLEERDFEVVEL